MREEADADEITRYLRFWGVFLGVLAADAFESMLLLLSNNKLRFGSVLVRPIIDYDVRLRYYIVQATPFIARVRQDGAVALGRARRKAHAVRDFKNADVKLAATASVFDRKYWPKASVPAIDTILSEPATKHEQRFTEMCNWLIANEATILGHQSPEEVRFRYQVSRGIWLFQSAPLHGDQSTLNDVLELDGDGEPTGQIHWESPERLPQALLFEACLRVAELFESFNLVRHQPCEVGDIRIRLTRIFFEERARHESAVQGGKFE